MKTNYKKGDKAYIISDNSLVVECQVHKITTENKIK